MERHYGDGIAAVNEEGEGKRQRGRELPFQSWFPLEKKVENCNLINF